MKVLKPLPHSILDYAWAGTMMAAPWLFGFSKNKKATINCVSAGAGIMGLSLMTKYPLGALKLIPFPTHGVIEAIAGGLTAADPWILGFSGNKRAKWTHVVAGLSTLAVVAITDYRAAERGKRQLPSGRGAGLAEQVKNLPEPRHEVVDLGPPTHIPEGVLE
ncbi:MAG TPA: SPW repeat protein [Blastocatellia bacterium]|nr:SPW repeat protein [Blastocatellia bacterium]